MATADAHTESIVAVRYDRSVDFLLKVLHSAPR